MQLKVLLFEGHLTEGGENTFTFSRPVYFPGRSLSIKFVLLSLDSYLGNIFWQSNPLSDFCNLRPEHVIHRPSLNLPYLLSSYLLNIGRLIHACVLEAFFPTD